MFRGLLSQLSLLHERGLPHANLTATNVLTDGHGGLLVAVRTPRQRPSSDGRAVRRGAANDQRGIQRDLAAVGRLLAATTERRLSALRASRDVRALRCDDWLKEVIYRSTNQKGVGFESSQEMDRTLPQRSSPSSSYPTRVHGRSAEPSSSSPRSSQR